jgi:hypothetical protein
LGRRSCMRLKCATTLPFIREIYYNEAPGIYFSSIVA